jgi:hypothetical protein
MLYMRFLEGFGRNIFSGWDEKSKQKKGSRERKDGMGLRVEGQASIEGVDGSLTAILGIDGH